MIAITDPMTRRERLAKVRERIEKGPSWHRLNKLVRLMDRLKNVRLPRGRRYLEYYVIYMVEGKYEESLYYSPSGKFWRRTQECIGEGGWLDNPEVSDTHAAWLSQDQFREWVGQLPPPKGGGLPPEGDNRLVDDGD